MVLGDHVAFFGRAPGPLTVVSAVSNAVLQQGFEGVSLFLVVSGFCLSYPILRRRHEGRADWFQVRTFFFRRCQRILPPYYMALGLFVTLGVLGHNRSITLPNVLAHIALIHNLTPWYASIDGPFWSLGLEWQWYLIFPLVLILAIRTPVGALIFCLTVAISWHLGTHDLWQLWPHASGALPARLFEFCCGIITAQIVLSSRRWSGPLCPILAWIVCSPILFAALPGAPAVSRALFGQAQPQPLFGVSFAALLLLGHFSRKAKAVLSWRPIVALGICSYSVYLVHKPIEDWVLLSCPAFLRPWPLLPLTVAGSGMLAGVVFYFAVERPLMRLPAPWQFIPRRPVHEQPVPSLLEQPMVDAGKLVERGAVPVGADRMVD